MGRQRVISPRRCPRLRSYLCGNPTLLFAYTLQDDQIHFAHPIIASTAKSFYFDKWHGISTNDQDTFKGSVPKPLIALIGTVVCSFLHCIPLYVAHNLHSIGMPSTNGQTAAPRPSSLNGRHTSQCMMKFCEQWQSLKTIRLTGLASMGDSPRGRALECTS